jgi:hypothetical protein
VEGTTDTETDVDGTITTVAEADLVVDATETAVMVTDDGLGTAGGAV